MLTNTVRRLFISKNSLSPRNIRLLTTQTQDDVVANDESEPQQKLLKLAVIGLPNSGKSTLINNLMDRKVIKC